MAYIGGCIIAVLVLSRDLRYIIYTCTTVAPIRFLQIVAKQYRQCLSSVALSLANIMTTSGPVILLIAYYDSTTVGWYGLVFRVATAPIGLITTAVSQSFWTEAASLSKSDPTELRRFYLGTIRRLSLIAAPSFTVFLLAPLYIPYLFGQEEWGGAGYLLAAVAPYLAGMIVFSPTTHLIVYRKAHWQLAIDLVTFIVSTGTFTSLALSGQSAAAALFGSSLIMLAGYLVRFAAHLRANQILSEEFNKRPATESLAIRSQYV
jgi:O-antigen/teichoic acid export membrane protein